MMEFEQMRGDVWGEFQGLYLAIVLLGDIQ
jgi:hypothetical protein